MLYDSEVAARIELMAETRRAEILGAADEVIVAGKKYYVSAAGDDGNDGLSPERAWRTLSKVSEAELMPGDGVFFRRGDVFRGSIYTKSGVTYGAYGEGEKPKLYGWDEDLADAARWRLVNEKSSIWKYEGKVLDPGTLVFDGGAKHCRKLIPSYIGGKFVCRDDEAKDFVISDEMTEDLDLYWHFEDILTRSPSRGQDFPVPEMGEDSLGEIYLRCDAGNPGKVFESIEAVTRRPMFRVGANENVRIDNLCIRYVGLHAIAAGGHVKGLTVTNCEIGWIGGTIQHYLGTDPNYPQGGRGTVTRFGNGVEIYGGCEDYRVENSWIYQCYDAGVTHQITTFGKKYTLTGVRYINNLIEKCVYAIEYFLDMNMGDTESCMRDILMKGNILRESGYGWGQQRHNKSTPALIKGWSYVNAASDYRVDGNVFDRCAYRLIHTVADRQASCPEMDGNTYIQHNGGMLGLYGGRDEGEPQELIFDKSAPEVVKNALGDMNAVVYMIE